MTRLMGLASIGGPPDFSARALSGRCATVCAMTHERTRIHIVVTEEEKATWTSAAGDVPLSRWIRKVVNESARATAVASPTEAGMTSLAAPVEPSGAPALPTVAAHRLTTDETRQFKPDFKGKS